MPLSRKEITALRLSRGLSQKEFYEQAGIEQSVGSRYEQGKTNIRRHTEVAIVCTLTLGTTHIERLRARVRRELGKRGA